MPASIYFAESNTLILGIRRYISVQLDPQTSQGTKVISYNLFLNITDGSPLGQFDNDDEIGWYIDHASVVQEENYHYYLNYPSVPEFGIKLPGMEVSTLINFTGYFEAIVPLSNPDIEQCSWGGSTFIKVPVEIHLLSPYLYHLGTLTFNSRITVYNNYQSLYFYTQLAMEINAGKKVTQLQCSGTTAAQFCYE